MCPQYACDDQKTDDIIYPLVELAPGFSTNVVHSDSNKTFQIALYQTGIKEDKS